MARVFSRSYGYDYAGNVLNITHVFGPPPTTEYQTFTYDHRDRLKSWVTSGINPTNNESYNYDKLGNFTSKAGSSYIYDSNHAAGVGGPYAVRTVDPPQGQDVHYTYDNNGNITDTDDPGNTRHYDYNVDNQAVLVSRNGAGGVTERYLYDADGERVRLTKGPQENWATFYMEGLWDEEHNQGNHSNTHTLYKFNGQVIAQREYWPHNSVPGSGLRGDYFNNSTLTNFAFTRYDTNADFNWGSGSPDVRLEDGHFSVEWTGTLTSTTAGTYTFVVEANGGARLWVNNTSVFDNWTDAGTLYTNSGQITLAASTAYAIKIQFADTQGNAEVHLKWQTPGAGTAVAVPIGQLSPPADDMSSPSARNELWYFHTDHLGSISVTTDATNQNPARRQEFDPWGQVRQVPSPNVNNTTLNYTGQRLDGSNLLYYHARYYDPVLGRFTTPDTIVPGVSDGKGGAAPSLGAEQNHKLTVDFHEPGFVSSMQKENDLTLEKGFWFQLKKEDKKDVKDPWGPANPQALNRYAYVLNNPVRFNDPSGHIIPLLVAAAVGLFSGVAIDVGIDFVTDNQHFDLGTSVGNSLKDPLTWIGAIPFGELAKLVKGGRLVEAGAKAIGAVCSFSEDTEVATIQGPIPISQIQVGDMVLAYDEKTNTTSYHEVTALLINKDTVLEHLVVSGEAIETTPEHPFYTLEYGWAGAGQLWVGAHVRQANGAFGVVQYSQIILSPEAMYNLTVEDAHAYFVGKGQWLVHNICIGDAGKYGSMTGKGYKAAGMELHHMPMQGNFQVRNAGGAIAIPDWLHDVTWGKNSSAASQYQRSIGFRASLYDSIMDLRYLTANFSDRMLYTRGMLNLLQYYRSLKMIR